jgi:integrase
MGAVEVEHFLTHLAAQRHVASATQNQAPNALVFLYRDVLRMELGSFTAMRAVRRRRAPTVLSRDEVRRFLAAMDGLGTTEPYALMARLMYGSGLRLMECCRLRVKWRRNASGASSTRRPDGASEPFDGRGKPGSPVIRPAPC